MIDVRRLVRPVGALFLALTVAAVLVGGLAQVRVSTDLESFLPAADAESRAYQQVTEQFGGDPVVVLLESKDGRDGLSADRIDLLLKLEGRLAGLSGVASVYGPATLLNQVAGQAQDLLAQLMGRRDLEINKARARAEERDAGPNGVKQAQARARERFDRRYGPLLVSAMPAGLPTLANPEFIENVVLTESGDVRGQWRFLVPDRLSLAILVRPGEGTSAAEAGHLVEKVRAAVDHAEIVGMESTVTGVPVLISGISERAVWEGPRLAAIATVGVALCLLLATWTRRSRRLVPLAVTVIAVAGAVAFLGWVDRPVSLGVVAFCSVLLGMGCYYPTYFGVGAARRTVLVVAGASAASLGTLALSPLPLVRDLGVTLAVGIVLAAGLGLLVRSWLVDGNQHLADEPALPAGGVPSPDKGGRRSRRGLFRITAVLLTCVAGVGWALLPALDLEADVAQFAEGLPEVKDADHVRAVVGSSGEIDLVLRGPDVLAPEALAWQREVHDRIIVEHGDTMRPVISSPALFAFLGRDPSPAEIQAAARLLPAYLVDAAVTRDRRTAVLSFGVDLTDLDTLAEARDEIARNTPLPPAGYESQLTGLPVVALHARDLISTDRVLSNVLGIAMAGAVLLLGLRRRIDAVLAVWAAALATGIGFVLLQVTGTALNPVTVGLGALTVAVGCEFTVVQAEARRSGSKTMARAVGIVALTSAVGYLTLVGSGLAAVRDFGAQLAVAVLLAAAASWVVVRAAVAPASPLHPSFEEEL